MVCLLAQSAAAQPTFQELERLQDQALRPAMLAVSRDDLPEARRLARVVLAEFERLPPGLQIAPVGDLQRLSRLFIEKGLFAEADLLLTRAASAWEPLMRRQPFSMCRT
ncbi:MAG: hypothetical protein ACT4QD_11885 [Acidobacteriota bacterium]